MEPVNVEDGLEQQGHRKVGYKRRKRHPKTVVVTIGLILSLILLIVTGIGEIVYTGRRSPDTLKNLEQVVRTQALAQQWPTNETCQNLTTN